MIKKDKDLKIAIFGLGYVGLPLALEFAKKRKVIGFDINQKRIKELKLGIDRNLEFAQKDFQSKKKLSFTYYEKDLKSANCYIITVPTPIDKFKNPDLKPLFKATKMISKIIKNGDIIIYESTVFPGCVEEVCVPVLEKYSKLKFNQDFFCGYSPERINPGDKKHTIANIKKITSGSTIEVAEVIDKLYNQIIKVGTYKASSIKVAEAAKVIENTQRDLNIALINELSMLFGKMDIDTQAVLKAAESKWNFLNFKPGLVGGHCIGVDPYYLTYKAKEVGYNPKIILAGREINDSMGKYVALKLINKMKSKKIPIKKSRILVMGLTFKENCPDTRNSGVNNVINELKKFGCHLELKDPFVNKKDIKKIYNIHSNQRKTHKNYDAVLIAVAHNQFKEMGINKVKKLCKKNHVLFDLKNLFNSEQVDLKL
ncbi:nucleotide sugar dehydrogenase [Candidatus Pelagibacter sp.]|nr:nucleotide sugar dehydrogenase [Candidatus Pelagibacter sp.]